MAEVCKNSLHASQEGKFLACAIEGKKSDFLKCMMEERFPHKTGQNALQDK